VLHGTPGAGDLRLEHRQPPTTPPGHVRVRVSRSGWCGSDVHFVYDGTARPAYTPIVLGHEAMGRVVDRADDVPDGPAVGDRVAIVPLLVCGACDRCRAGVSSRCRQRRCLGSDVDGTLADEVAVPASNLLAVPDEVSDELAAVATDSVATAYHAVRTRGGLDPGARVAIWGVGGLGLAAVGVARSLGAGTIVAVDPRPAARGWAVASGADAAFHPDDAVAAITADGGVDLAVEFVGRQAAVLGAVRSLDDGGRAVIVGIGSEAIDAGRAMTFVLREREVVGAYGNDAAEIAAVLRLLADGRLSLPHVVAEVVPMADAVTALARVRDGVLDGARSLIAVHDGTS